MMFLGCAPLSAILKVLADDCQGEGLLPGGSKCRRVVVEFDEFPLWRSLDGDDIEAMRALGAWPVAQILARGLFEMKFLAPVHRLLTIPVRIAAPRPHFDKNQRPMIVGDQIDLALSGGEISFENAPTLTVEELGCLFLAPAAQCQVIGHLFSTEPIEHHHFPVAEQTLNDKREAAHHLKPNAADLSTQFNGSRINANTSSLAIRFIGRRINAKGIYRVSERSARIAKRLCPNVSLAVG